MMGGTEADVVLEKELRVLHLDTQAAERDVPHWAVGHSFSIHETSNRASTVTLLCLSPRTPKKTTTEPHFRMQKQGFVY